jgi:hypothetical protein
MVGSDLTRLSPTALSLLTNEEALAIHNDPYGLQPIKVDEPTPGIQIWAKPMAIAGRRAFVILNRTDSNAQVKVDWRKLGLKHAPKSSHDVWNKRDFASVDSIISVASHDLALVVVDGEDEAPAEYAANRTGITRIQAPHGSAFARLHYANTSGHVVVLPKGPADLSFEGRQVAIHKLDVYAW